MFPSEKGKSVASARVAQKVEEIKRSYYSRNEKPRSVVGCAKEKVNDLFSGSSLGFVGGNV